MENTTLAPEQCLNTLSVVEVSIKYSLTGRKKLVDKTTHHHGFSALGKLSAEQYLITHSVVAETFNAEIIQLW